MILSAPCAVSARKNLQRNNYQTVLVLDSTQGLFFERNNIGNNMCTAVTRHGRSHLFGRTLDVDRVYGEQVIITPSNFLLKFRNEGKYIKHYSIIGIGCVINGYPLYFDAVNEHGLAMAGLNFPQNAVYYEKKEGRWNVASFEFIPFVLGRSKDIREARKLLDKINITNDSFDEKTPSTPLHWIISDKSGSIVVESTDKGLDIYEDPFGVLTNNPPFLHHFKNMSDYMNITPKQPINNICPTAELSYYSLGLGAVGLPGDHSSKSRFVKAVFANENTSCQEDGEDDISSFFHVMDTVAVPRGCVQNDAGELHFTQYTSCADLDAKNYYFTTYNDRRIRAVSLKDEYKNEKKLICYSMDGREDMLWLC